MPTARDVVILDLKRMLAEVGMRPSPFAKEAKVATTTLTRFLREPDAPLLSNTTMAKLRVAHERLLTERQSGPRLDHLTKDAKKRALIARLLAASDDQVVAIKQAIDSLPKVAPTGRKLDDDPT